jgi:hypothetical protein
MRRCKRWGRAKQIGARRGKFVTTKYGTYAGFTETPIKVRHWKIGGRYGFGDPRGFDKRSGENFAGRIVGLFRGANLAFFRAPRPKQDKNIRCAECRFDQRSGAFFNAFWLSVR